MKYTRRRYALPLLQSAALFLALAAPSAGVAGQTVRTVSYEKLLSDAAARQKDGKADPVREVMDIFAPGAEALNAGAVVASFKSNWPAYEPGTPVRVQPEVRERLVWEGEQYARFVRVVKPLLQFCGLESRVRPLLFKSEVPVTMLVSPNALVFSTRAVALLDDAEIEAMASHEVLHILAQPLKVKAVDERDEKTLRLIELFCDAGGTALVAARGGDPKKMISGLHKMSGVLEVEFQEHQRGTKHPPMKMRKQLNDALTKVFAASVATTRAGDH